jgi:hypothetical protein
MIPQPYPFERLHVDQQPLGGTRVQWHLSGRLREAGPYRYRLEFAPTPTPAADDWQEVGLEAEDTYFLVDDTRRLYGQSLDARWRVRLATAAAQYASAPASATLPDSFRDWRIGRKVLRQEEKRRKYEPVRGLLLKERRYGPPCTNCLDPLTREPTRSDCPRCFGTGFERGYYPGTPVWFDLGLDASEESQDNQARGTVRDPSAVTGRFAGMPRLQGRDLIVEAKTGRRWRVGKVQEAGAVRGHVLTEVAELRLLPFGDSAYEVPADG